MSKQQTAKEGERKTPKILLDKPVYLLTDCELDQLSQQHRLWAINHRAYLRDSGQLAQILCNPTGTKYETVFDSNLGWKLRPVVDEVEINSSIAIRCERDALRVLVESTHDSR